MDRWFGKVAVITGANGSLGLCLCQNLVENGLKVVGLARRIDKIEEVSRKLTDRAGKLYAFKCDISKEDNILRAFHWIRENVGMVQIFLNNACLARSSNLTDGNAEIWRKIFEVNVMGFCLCAREMIKPLKECDLFGQIIHVNWTSFNNFGAENASKNSTRTLTETIREELRGFNSKIKVTTLSPGLVQNDCRIDDSSPEDVHETMLNPEDISESILYILSTPVHVQVEELIVRSINESS